MVLECLGFIGDIIAEVYALSACKNLLEIVVVEDEPTVTADNADGIRA